MRFSSLVLWAVFTFVISIPSYAQKQLSDAEIQHFFSLIRQTKEFKALKLKTDSINATKRSDEIPEDIDVHLVKKMSSAPQDDNIFPAVFERTLMGMTVERYSVEYDKQKRTLGALKKDQVRLKIN